MILCRKFVIVKDQTIRPKLDRINPVKPSASALVIQCWSSTNSEVQ